MGRIAAISSLSLWTGIAAWLSLGTISFTSAGGSRLGLLPASPVAFAVAVAAAGVAAAMLHAGAPRSPLSLLVLPVLPWLPTRVPAAFLLWSGPVAAVIWIAVGLILALGIPRRSTLEAPAASTEQENGSAVAVLDKRDLTPLRAGVIAVLVFGAAAWRAAPSVPAGDEPHYLIITQSLWLDGDLKIRNNHRRGDYRVYYNDQLEPHVQRLGRDGEIYSIHAPGLSAIVLPAFAIAGHRGVVAFLILLCAAGAALAWRVAWLATSRADAAWFGWASITLPVTAVFHSFTVYPDAPGGVFALTGLWALLRAEGERRSGSERVLPWLWHGAALSILPWLHTRFALIAGGFGALVLLRLSTTPNPAAKAVAFLSVPAVSAVLWVGYFVALYGTPDPTAPYAASEVGSLAFVPGGLTGLLFDQRFGLLPYAPVLAFAFAGLAVMIVRSNSRRLALELLFVMIPYLLTVTHFAMWWGGWSPPARFFVPVLPLLAVPAAIFWVAMDRRRERALSLAALICTVLATVMLVTVDRGRLAFNLRDTSALWLEWLSQAADLPQALPSWTRAADAPLFRDVAIWLAAALVATVVIRRAAKAGVLRSRTAMHVGLGWALAMAAMGASTSVWAARGVDGRSVTSSQMQLLHAVASTPRAVAVDLDRARPIAARNVPGRLRIELTRPVTAARAAGRDDPALFNLPPVPAGEYRFTLVAAAPRGWLMVGVRRDPATSQRGDQYALWTGQVPPPTQPIDLRFPIAIRGIVVRGDEEARQTVRGLIVEPVSVMPPGQWGGVLGRRAVRYGRAIVFFLDDRSFPEPEAFWVRGARSTAVVIQPDDFRPAVNILIRNGPMPNHITIDVAGRRTDLEFDPDEEQRIVVPVETSRRAVLVTLSAAGGFRPSEHDPASRDERFLGVWVKVE